MTSDSPVLRKARGAFFTPPEISRFIAQWAIRGPGDTVLEPSCGEASFLLAAGDRLRDLTGGARASGRLFGVELHAASAAAAAALLRQRGLTADIETSDFFDVAPDRRYDAVIGNPPYVRYQQFAGAARAKGLEAALAEGVRLTGLASAWAPFVVHAARFLKPGGRLGLVLPAELLTVKYAAPVRRFLLERFASVRLVMFEELVFPGVLEEVVLLLAEGTGPAPRFEVYQARDLGGLAAVPSTGGVDGALWTGFAPDHGEKWTPALLSSVAVEAYRNLLATDAVVRLKDWGSTYLGAVSGNNKYFALTPADAHALQIPKRELLRISPPGSRHLRGLTFTDDAWRELGAGGAACYLFYPDADKPSAAAQAYIAQGEVDGVHKAYKCRVRSPWWRVPVVAVPDLLLTYMDHERPRIVANHANVRHLNSLYGVRLKPKTRALGKELLPVAALNSLTMLGSEMVGRAYGGGLLKLEPREADLMPMPSAAILEAAAPGLRALEPQLASALRNNDIDAAVKLVDRVLLVEQLSMTFDTIRALREARAVLFSRRATRGGAGGRADD